MKKVFSAVLALLLLVALSSCTVVILRSEADRYEGGTAWYDEDGNAIYWLRIPEEGSIICDGYHWYSEYNWAVIDTLMYRECRGCDCSYLSRDDVRRHGMTFTKLSRDSYALSSYSERNASSTEQVVIPFRYKGVMVTAISDCAFYDSADMREIFIPSTVTSIGTCAFQYCSSLTSIRYQGTCSAWEMIEKESGWNYGVGTDGSLTVYCSDGVLSIT